MSKLILFFQIHKFYNIFGEEVGHNFIHKLSDMTYDNLYDVLFDLNEVLDYTFRSKAYELDEWLTKLQAKIERRCAQ